MAHYKPAFASSDAEADQWVTVHAVSRMSGLAALTPDRAREMGLHVIESPCRGKPNGSVMNWVHIEQAKAFAELAIQQRSDGRLRGFGFSARPPTDFQAQFRKYLYGKGIAEQPAVVKAQAEKTAEMRRMVDRVAVGVDQQQEVDAARLAAPPSIEVLMLQQHLLAMQQQLDRVEAYQRQVAEAVNALLKAWA